MSTVPFRYIIHKKHIWLTILSVVFYCAHGKAQTYYQNPLKLEADEFGGALNYPLPDYRTHTESQPSASLPEASTDEAKDMDIVWDGTLSRWPKLRVALQHYPLFCRERQLMAFTMLRLVSRTTPPNFRNRQHIIVLRVTDTYRTYADALHQVQRSKASREHVNSWVQSLPESTRVEYNDAIQETLALAQRRLSARVQKLKQAREQLLEVTSTDSVLKLDKLLKSRDNLDYNELKALPSIVR